MTQQIASKQPLSRWGKTAMVLLGMYFVGMIAYMLSEISTGAYNFYSAFFG